MVLLKGVGISPGKIQGIAYVHYHTDDISADIRGRILVVERPELVLVLQSIKFGVTGLVSQYGTRTSHGCVIAKSVGLPCIASVPDLLSHIRQGQEIMIDGSFGFVEIIEKST